MATQITRNNNYCLLGFMKEDNDKWIIDLSLFGTRQTIRYSIMDTLELNDVKEIEYKDNGSLFGLPWPDDFFTAYMDDNASIVNALEGLKEHISEHYEPENEDPQFLGPIPLGMFITEKNDYVYFLTVIPYV
jgi:hypothetical protein